MEIFLLTVILLLLLYIAWLHIKLIKRDIRADSLIKQIAGPNKSDRIGEIRDERIFDENIIKFIFESEKETRVYLHYTKLRTDAENIINEGFRFVESFYRTAFHVTNDKLDLMIKHNSKKYFGDYAVVICIANKIIKHYIDQITKAGLKNCNYENILTEKPPEKNENTETIYTLPSKYIKGVINHRTGEIIKNPDFDPGYSSPWFDENIKNLKAAKNFNA